MLQTAAGSAGPWSYVGSLTLSGTFNPERIEHLNGTVNPSRLTLLKAVGKLRERLTYLQLSTVHFTTGVKKSNGTLMNLEGAGSVDTFYAHANPTTGGEHTIILPPKNLSQQWKGGRP